MATGFRLVMLSSLLGWDQQRKNKADVLCGLELEVSGLLVDPVVELPSPTREVSLDHDSLCTRASPIRSCLLASSKIPFDKFRAMIASATGLVPDRQRIRRFPVRENGTRRPTTVVTHATWVEDRKLGREPPATSIVRPPHGCCVGEQVRTWLRRWTTRVRTMRSS